MDSLGDLPFSVVDVGVITVLFISALLAYARGFVHELPAVASWVGAIFATIYGFPYLEPHARNLIPIELAADLAASVTIFVITLATLSGLTHSVTKRVKDSALGALDRALGFLFGLARGAIIICIAYIGLELVIPHALQPVWVREARSMELIVPGKELLTFLIPDRVGNSVFGAAGKVRDEAEQAIGTNTVVRELLSPVPKSEAVGDQGAYGDKERQDMQRLIEGNQQQ